MIPLYTVKEHNEAASSDKMKLSCIYCKKPFLKTKRYINHVLKNGVKNSVCGSCEYCSTDCKNKSKTLEKVYLTCTQCKTIFTRDQATHRISQKRSKKSNYFCSKSCAAIYNNAHKTTGTRRSKLEKHIEEQLGLIFPDLEIHYNRKNAINSELDIYIPKFSLAFELNGIFHYEPIYGKKKLAQIENNDKRKMQACLEQDIELCIIDSSGLKYFKPKNAKKYLDIIVSIINSK